MAAGDVVLVTIYCKVVVLNHRKHVSPDNFVP